MTLKELFNSESVKVRMFTSVVVNVTRSGLGFISTLVLARGLSPSGYGDQTFLLGSFVAIKAVLDLGSSNAFYTFISKKQRGREFYLVYFGWLAIQFAITLLFLVLVMPAGLVNKIWLNQPRSMIILAFLAFFAQQQLWQAISGVGEAARKTVRVQAVSLMVAVIHLLTILVLLTTGLISVRNVLMLIMIEYSLGSAWAYVLVRRRQKEGENELEEVTLGFRDVLREYAAYCRPLVVFSVVGFAYQFWDTWLLQKFGGSTQQGFYQVAFQFSALSLLATTSVLKVFWKEIADAYGKLDNERALRLYRRFSKGLLAISAIISCFLIPWSEEIARYTLGVAYFSAWPALAILLLYPIHQSLGQVSSTVFLAAGRTKEFTAIGIAMMIVSLPVSYLIQAPSSGMLIPGLHLGAYGMALKMVVLNIISVNVQVWILGRFNHWSFDWQYQVVNVFSFLGLGFAAKYIVGMFWNLGAVPRIWSLLPPVFVSALFYTVGVVALLFVAPWIAGIERGELAKFSRRVLKYV